MASVSESTWMPGACGGGVRATTARTAAGEPGGPVVARHQGSRAPNIADRYAVVLRTLRPRQRLGVIAALSVGFYDGWRPTEAELTAYLAAVFGIDVTGPPDHGGVAATPAAMTPGSASG
jgi:hypothetical protein